MDESQSFIDLAKSSIDDFLDRPNDSLACPCLVSEGCPIFWQGWNNQGVYMNSVKITDGLRIILSSLERIEFGRIDLVFPEGKVMTYSGPKQGPHAKIVVRDMEIFDMIISKSDIGLGESYIKSLWDTESVSNLIEFAVMNRGALRAAMIGQWHRILRYKVKHLINRNSKRGSQKNISAHYDLGNSFYKLWLDESMTYSSAYWGTNSELSLASAQNQKYKLLLDNLQAKPGAHILEIGCGWGGFAEFAARSGMRVTAITISEEQRTFAVERMRLLGLETRVEILFMDYRELKGQFDHVVSIEMLEAVGIEYWQEYFKKINEILTPGGTVSIQSITIHDSQFEQYRKGTDFIQQYIFPGGLLPCEKEITKVVKQTTGCQPDFLRFGMDYARTLRLWAEKFRKERAQVAALGYSDEFQKMWEFYLGYCEGAFRSGQINVVMISFRSY